MHGLRIPFSVRSIAERRVDRLSAPKSGFRFPAPCGVRPSFLALSGGKEGAVSVLRNFTEPFEAMSHLAGVPSLPDPRSVGFPFL